MWTVAKQRSAMRSCKDDGSVLTAAKQPRRWEKAAERSEDMGLWLHEVRFFLEDMFKGISAGLRWLLAQAAAKRDNNAILFLCGDEPFPALSAAVIASIDDLLDRTSVCELNGPRRVAAVITSVGTEERNLLEQLSHLKFHCLGRIEVFHVDHGANVFQSYVAHLRLCKPQWFIEADPALCTRDWQCMSAHSELMVHAVVVAAFFIDRGWPRLWFVFDKKPRHLFWAFPGGSVCQGADLSVTDTVRREWNEEVIGHSWEDSLVGEPKVIYVEPTGMAIVGCQYACQPFVLVRASEVFYRLSSNEAVYQMPVPRTGYVRSDKDVWMHHAEGWAYVEHDRGAWCDIDLGTGRLTPPQDCEEQRVSPSDARLCQLPRLLEALSAEVAKQASEGVGPWYMPAKRRREW